MQEYCLIIKRRKSTVITNALSTKFDTKHTGAEILLLERGIGAGETNWNEQPMRSKIGTRCDPGCVRKHIA